MNLTKDESIIKLLDELRPTECGWEIVDHWDADLCAIGLSSNRNPERLVYVSTYQIDVGHFDFECEVRNEKNPLGYDVIRSGQNVDYATLKRELIGHLDDK